MINWLHDYWYDSGFNEAAGNAQLTTTAAAASKAIRCASRRRTTPTAARATTPTCPRRPTASAAHADVHVDRTAGGDADAHAGRQRRRSAPRRSGRSTSTSPRWSRSPTTAPARRRPTPASRSSTLAGKIALVDRGNCTFAVKALNAQAAGAVGVIIANNVAGPLRRAGRRRPAVTIGALSISQADGDALKASLAARAGHGPHVPAVTGTERDGAIDNTIIAHEWGHYLHHRLADCGNSSAAR